MKLQGVTIKPEWVLYGVVAGLLVVWLYSRRDRNADGVADGLAGGLGYDAGRVVPDFVGGVGAGLFDGTASIFGGGDSDCARAKAAGDKFGIYWACWPKDWPVFN